jgi:hypothetical protein
VAWLGPLPAWKGQWYSSPTSAPGGVLRPGPSFANAVVASSRVINKRVLPVILGCLLMAFPAYSQPPFGPDRLITPFIARQPQFRPGISLDQAIQRIRRETGGRILAADTVRNNDTVTYRIKVLMPDGRVRVFHVDAQG